MYWRRSRVKIWHLHEISSHRDPPVDSNWQASEAAMTHCICLQYILTTCTLCSQALKCRPWVTISMSTPYKKRPCQTYRVFIQTNVYIAMYNKCLNEQNICTSFNYITCKFKRCQNQIVKRLIAYGLLNPPRVYLWKDWAACPNKSK